MPAITDPPPADVLQELGALGAALDDAVPAKRVDRNLLIGTWNIRHFGDVTEKWRSEPGDAPQARSRDVRCIAEIVSRFDVVAIQEVRENLRGLRHMLRRSATTGR